MDHEHPVLRENGWELSRGSCWRARFIVAAPWSAMRGIPRSGGSRKRACSRWAIPVDGCGRRRQAIDEKDNHRFQHAFCWGGRRQRKIIWYRLRWLRRLDVRRRPPQAGVVDICGGGGREGRDKSTSEPFYHRTTQCWPSWLRAAFTTIT